LSSSETAKALPPDSSASVTINQHVFETKKHPLRFIAFFTI
jgi:hypothetical protein